MALQALHGVNFHSDKANGMEEDENVYMGNMNNQCQLYMPPLSKVSLGNRGVVGEGFADVILLIICFGEIRKMMYFRGS